MDDGERSFDDDVARFHRAHTRCAGGLPSSVLRSVFSFS